MPRFSSAALHHLRESLAHQLEHDDVPGLVAVVSGQGETHEFALGSRTADGSEPMTHDTIFRITSMTKPVTAAATMMLIEDGRLGIDDAVDHWLPELADRRVLTRLDAPLTETVPARRAITVRDLLTFTNGFGLIMAPPDEYSVLRAATALGVAVGIPAPAHTPAPDEWLRRLGSLPLVHQPGEQWMYGLGADVLGVLIARASGQPFESFLDERLFGPLGMHDTAFSVPDDKLHRFGPEYWTDDRTNEFDVYDAAAGGQWSAPPAFRSGAAGLVSTAHDYLAFSTMLLHHGLHGSRRFLRAESVAAMTRDQLSAAQKAASDQALPGLFDHHGWGYGMAVVTSAANAWQPLGQFGWDGGLGTSAYSDPGTQLTTILMTPRMWTGPEMPALFREFRRLAHAALG